MSKELSTKTKPPEWMSLIHQSQKEIEKALPAIIKSDRFIRLVYTEIRKNEKLQECNPHSVLAAVMISAQLGLEFGPQQHIFLIPYGKEATIQLGYKGLLELVRRSGHIKRVDAAVVYENDHFESHRGSSQKIIHVQKFPRTQAILVYALAELDTGAYQYEVMDMEECDYIRDTYSKGADRPDSPWKKSYLEMCKKTVLRRLCKLLPLSTEVHEALVAEENYEVVEHQERKPELVAKAAALPRGVSDAEREAAWEELEKLYNQCQSLKIDTDDLPAKGYEFYTTQEIFACLGVVRERLKKHGGQNGSGPTNP